MNFSARRRPRRTRRPRLIPLAASAVVAALGATLLSACSAGESGSSDGKLDITASFYPMAYLAERIGGPHVKVDNLTKPGQEPHDLEISARQTSAVERSGLILYLKGLQPSVDEIVAQSSVKNKVDAASLTTLEKHGTEVGGHAQGHEHGHGEEDAGQDPHIWLDPVRYAQVAKGVGKAMEKADPDHAAAYRKNTTALLARLGELDTAYEDGLKDTRTKVFITTHAAFGYLAERYGLTEEAINGLNPESEPSPARIKDLHRMAKADGVSTVFYETLVSDRTAKTVAGDTGLRTDVLDPLEGITDASRGTDYLQVMKSNLTALQKALGARA